MSILGVLGGIVALPVAVASDVIKPLNPLREEELSSDTAKVVRNIVENTKKDD